MGVVIFGEHGEANVMWLNLAPMASVKCTTTRYSYSIHYTVLA